MIKTGVDFISIERTRQMQQEGFAPKHDDKHIFAELATAAACYALPKKFRDTPIFGAAILKNFLQYLWPWSWKWWKPTPEDRIKELTKAGALIAAEIDRLIRLEEKDAPRGPVATYEVWFSELKKVATKYYGFPEDSTEYFAEKDWKCFYDDELTPREALDEDFLQGGG